MRHLDFEVAKPEPKRRMNKIFPSVLIRLFDSKWHISTCPPSQSQGNDFSLLSGIPKDLQVMIFDPLSTVMALPFPEGECFFVREGLRSEGY
jgi:hypothetical protein